MHRCDCTRRLQGPAPAVACLLAALAAGRLVAQAPHLPEAALAPGTAVAVPTQPLTLAMCRQIALERQPAVAAARATLAAAVARSAAVDNLRVPTCLAPDLPVRRKQAALGVVIAEAGVRRAESDAIYSVTYSYLSALYAAEQVGVGSRAVKNLEDFQVGVENAVKSGKFKNIVAWDQDRVAAYLLLARGRREEAVQGEKRALAALREAMGLSLDCPLMLAASSVPEVEVSVNCPEIVALALARRGELVQAATAAEVTGFEVEAQHARRRPKAPTFASGSDIHANQVPPSFFDDLYRPGGVPLEMPTTLTGSRCDRVEQAQAYHARAGAVVEKTRNLIVLEAEQACARWQEAEGKLKQYRPAVVRARKAFDDIQDVFEKGIPRFSVDLWLTAGVLVSDLRVEINRARYQRAVALASLERITAGAFCPGLDTAPSGPPPNGDKPAGDDGHR